MGNPVVFCLFAAALFDDDFEPSWLHGAAWLALVALGIFGLLSGVPQVRWICSGLGLICNAIGVWYVLAGRSLDLVEERRRLRAALVIVVGVYSAAIIISEIACPPAAGGRHSTWPTALVYWRSPSYSPLVLLSVSRDGA